MTKPSTRALIVIFLLVPLGPLAIDIFLPSMPQMVDYFKSSDTNIQLTISLYVLALGLAQLIAGPVSDKYGRKISIIIGLILYGFASLAITFTQAIFYLYLFRVIQGLGAAFTMVSAMAWIRDHYDGIAAAKWLSYMGGVTSAIPTIAPVMGSLLAVYWGWFGGFYAMSLAALFIFLLALNALPSERPIILTTDTDDTEKLSCNVKDILSNRQFLTFSAANLLSFGGLLSYVAISPIVAIKEAGLTQLHFSILFGLIGAGQITASFIAPKLMHSIGRSNTVLFGLAMIILSGITLFFVEQNKVNIFFILSAFGCAGFSMISGAATSLSLEKFKYCAGLATSIDGFMRMVGGATIAAVASLMAIGSFQKLALVFTLSIVAFTLVLAWKIKNRAD